MLKEIVDFSRKLNEEGIYQKVLEDQRIFDQPVLVIESNELEELYNNYFVFYDILTVPKEEEIYYNLVLEGKENKQQVIETEDLMLSGLSIKKLSDEEESWGNILKNLKFYIQKLPSDAKGNKSIGTNSGTNSYHILIFEAKIDTIFKDKNTFFKKMKHTYEKSILLGLPENNSYWVSYLSKLKEDDFLEDIFDNVQSLLKCTQKLNTKKGIKENTIKSLLVVVKVPEKFYKQQNIYQEWYDDYLSKKVFKTTEKKYPSGICSSCLTKNVEVWLPDTFHNLDQKKEFIRHVGRFKDHNTAICGNCSLLIYKFQGIFLNKLRITTFPLFVQENQRALSINFIKNNRKIGFKEIIRDIYQKTNKDQFDYYLTIYNRDHNLISIDYITGFQFYRNGVSVFQVESIFDRDFFENKLRYHYFSKDVDTKNKNKDLDLILYTYRSVIFDYIYRAKYNSLSLNSVYDMFFMTLKRLLKDLYQGELEQSSLKKIYKLYENIEFLDTFFGGVFVNTVKEIKDSKEIKDLKSLSYYLGEAVYFLLTKSEKREKTHSMVEPFITVNNFGTMGVKLEELFNAYKHKLWLKSSAKNQIFSQIWAFLYDVQKEKFTRDLKILFYAGYFSSDKNIFFEGSEKEKEEGEKND